MALFLLQGSGYGDRHHHHEEDLEITPLLIAHLAKFLEVTRDGPAPQNMTDTQELDPLQG